MRALLAGSGNAAIGFPAPHTESGGTLCVPAGRALTPNLLGDPRPCEGEGSTFIPSMFHQQPWRSTGFRITPRLTRCQPPLPPAGARANRAGSSSSRPAAAACRPA